jgi:hypothetical protein
LKIGNSTVCQDSAAIRISETSSLCLTLPLVVYSYVQPGVVCNWEYPNYLLGIHISARKHYSQLIAVADLDMYIRLGDRHLEYSNFAYGI